MVKVASEATTTTTTLTTTTDALLSIPLLSTTDALILIIMSFDTPRLIDPQSLSTLPDILSHLSCLQSAEADLSTSLTNLLSVQDPIVHSLARLRSLIPSLDDLHCEARLLSQTVSGTAKTAGHVGGRVRSLDEEMRRVREAAERVGQVMELKVLSFTSYLYHSSFMPSATSGMSRFITCFNGKQGLGICNQTLRPSLNVTFRPYTRIFR